MPIEIDSWSLLVSPLVLKCNGHQIGTATGFFWKELEKTYLITNWHVLSGRDPATDEAKNINGALPDQIVYKRYIQGESYNEVYDETISLTDSEGNFLWFEHCAFGRGVDVGAIEVPANKQVSTCKGLQDTYVIPIPLENENGDDADSWNGYLRKIGSDVFVLGFPLDQRPTGHFPIWKRASIATEMAINLNGKPAFLIDTATREGMSGSPVISLDLKILPLFGPTAVDRQHHFIGIYSGRYIGKTTEEAQLGIVWRQSLILDVIYGQKNYKWP